MPINSKNKGNTFERKIAKRLSEWSGYKFHRTPMSGALHNWNDKRVVSDIVPQNDLKFPFSIECKHQEYDWDFDFILKNTSMLWKHWEQAVSDAEAENLVPMLVFTKNYRETYVSLPVDVYVLLFKDKKKPSNISVYVNDKEVTIFNFEDFLLSLTIDDILNLNLV